MSETGTCTSIINLRYQDGSEGSPTNPAKFSNQDYEQLKAYSNRRDKLFVDSTFPPDNRSLGDLPDMPTWKENKVEWLRPKDILKAQGSSDEPSFSLKGASRFDFGQGNVGNCWFLAAISALTFQKGLMAQVVPMDQSFRNYAGIFHFRFWRFGKWVDVVIDDHLPTIDGQLLSVRSKGGNEFWAPLMEKAYAKVCGTYADMNAGLPSEACKDFCGGVHMTFELRQVHDYSHDEKLWLQLSRATGCKSMICCGTAPKGGEIVNTVANTGLVDAHAYSVTGVTEVELYGSKKRLVRCMNPWGSQEWSGDWSDKSNLWDRVSSDDRSKCSVREDGEFWMELEDFCHYFNMMSICCENPNFTDGDLTCQWKCMIYDGKWVAGRTAGGRSSTGSFAKNPQYRINVTKINKKEENDMNILISLMQKPQLEGRKDAQKRYHAINVSVYKVPEGTRSGRLPSSFFDRSRPVNLRQMYAYQREKIGEYSLELGEYVIVPSTYKAHQNAEFVLTVFSKADSKISPHDHDDDDDDDHHSDDEDNDVPKPSTHSDDDDDHDDHDDDDTDSDRALFKRYADQRGNLSARQLRKLLNDNFPHGTSWGYDTCRSMITMMDTDHNWRMGFPEFSKLWTKINEYKTLFKRSDVNRNGTLQSSEVQKAIESKGIDANDFMVQIMMIRYSGSYTTLEDFIVLMLRMENASDVFKNNSSDGVITMNWEEWSSNMMYN